MNRHRTILVRAAIAALALTLTTTAARALQDPPPSPGAGRFAEETPVDADTKLIARLHETIVDADYDADDFEDVIEMLRDTYELNIHVSWKHLAAAGVRKDDRIELKLKQVSLALLLDMILREAPSDDIDPLGYSVRRGILIISTREALNRDTLLKTYDITDLIESGYSIRRFANTPVLGLQLTGREFVGGEERQPSPPDAGGGGGGGGGIYGDPVDEPDRISLMERVQEIIDLFVDTVTPNEWNINGGEIASIRVHENILFIHHTVEGHRQIETMFSLIRKGHPAPLDAEVIVVRLRADRAARFRREVAPSFPRLNTETIEQLLADDETSSIVFRATTMGHNGKRLWFSALTQREVLAGMNARLSVNASAFDPVTGVATEGLELIVLPLLDPDGTGMSLDVQLAAIPPSDISERSVKLTPDQDLVTIDRVTRSMRTVSANASLSIDQGVVFTIPHSLDAQGRAAEYEDWLIVRVRPIQ